MSFNKAGAAFAAVSTVLVLSSATRAAEMKAAGTMEASVVQVQAHPLDAAGGVILSQILKGTTKSPGAPLDGAEILISENDVLDKGNGPQQGSISLVNEKGSITNEIHGVVKTVMVGGQPHTSASGTYRMIAGTGIFAGGSGHGTYSVTFTSKTAFTGDYKGVLSLPKRQASR